MQAGRMMRCWHQQLRGHVLGFHTSSSWARSLESHRIVHPARLWGSASLSGPCCPQCLRAKLTLPNTPPSLPLCPASFATPFHSGPAPACPGKSGRWWGEQNSPAIYYTWEIRAAFFPFLVPTCFIMMERCCSLKHRWGWEMDSVLASILRNPCRFSSLGDRGHVLRLIITVCVQTLCLLLETGNMTP